MSNPFRRAIPLACKPEFSLHDFYIKGYNYPELKPFEEGFMEVGDGHMVFYQVAGNPNGIPAVALHGGPGEGAKPAYGEHFDPNIHKIIIYDQRGAGSSFPYAEVKGNTIENLVGDLHKLKNHLNIQSPWSIYGISWGSALAMHYATTYPDDVDKLILDATCFGDQPSAKWLVDPSQKWLHEGTEEQRAMKASAYGEYVGFIRNADFTDIPQEKEILRNLHLSEAYYRCLKGDYGHRVALEAAKQFMLFDTRLLSPDIMIDPELIDQARDSAEDNLALSRLFFHYYINEYTSEGPNMLINRMLEKWNGKTVMIHGTEDIVTPLEIAELLRNKLSNVGKPLTLYNFSGYGHFKMDESARFAIRQIIQNELEETFLQSGITYCRAVSQRMAALEAMGLRINITEEQRAALEQASRTHRLTTGMPDIMMPAFVTANLSCPQRGLNGLPDVA